MVSNLNEGTRQPNNGPRSEAMNATTSDHGIEGISSYDTGTAADQGEEDLEDEVIQWKGKKRKL